MAGLFCVMNYYGRYLFEVLSENLLVRTAEKFFRTAGLWTENRI